MPIHSSLFPKIKLADFTNQTGLSRDRYREQVFAVKTEKTIVGYGRSVSGKAVWANRKATVFTMKPGAGDDRSIVNLSFINSKAYDSKFSEITGVSHVDAILADCCRRILKNRNGTLYEELYAVNAKSGKIMTYIKGKQEKGIQMTTKLEKLLTSSREHSIKIIHNHPNNSSFSSVDIKTMQKYKSIKTTIAAAHDGTVFEISGVPQTPELLTDFNNERKYSTFDSIWERLMTKYHFEYRRL